MREYTAYPKYKGTGVEWFLNSPHDWEVLPARRIFKQVRDPANPEDEQLAATQKYGVIPQRLFMEYQDQKVVLALSGTGNFKHVECDDFVISLRSFQGGIERCHYEGCVSPAYTVMRREKDIASSYFSFLLKSGGFISVLQSVTTGIREGKTITYEQFGSISLPFPSKSEQQYIANFLDHETAKIDRLIAGQERLIELLKEKRQAVISHAITKGLNPDAPMKDSGMEWLGEVPAHWDIVRLKRVGAVNQGCTFPHIIQGKSIGDFPWYKVNDMNRSGNEDTMGDAENYVGRSVASELRATIFPGGTVIFPRVGAALLTNKRRMLSRSSIVDDNVYGFIPRTINSRYAYYMLTLIDLECFCSPGLVPTVTIPAVKNIEIPLPPLKEQESIVNHVERVNPRIQEIITKSKLSLSLLQERRTALISAAVTGKIDVRSWQKPETEPEETATAVSA